MDEMNNLNVEDTVTEVVEVATDKLTFKENLMAYSLAGVFVVGLTTVGYFGYKGAKKIAKKIRDKRESKVVAEESKDRNNGPAVDYDKFENEENDSE